MKRKVFLILVLGLAIMLAGCNSAKTAKTIAEVNGEKITQADFDELYAVLKADYEFKQMVTLDKTKDKEILKDLESKTFENLVLQKLIRQEASKQGIKLDKKEVDATIKDIKDSKNEESKDGYKKFLDETKFSEAGLKEYLETQQLNNKLSEKVTADVTVNETDVRKYYDENKDQFRNPGGIQISHILVAKEDLAQAEQIITKLNQDADFAALAKEYSIDPGSKNNGGDLGTPVNASSNLVPEFLKAALALEPGQYTQKPVESEFGYHIIKAGARTEAGIMPFDQVKAELLNELENQEKYQYYNDYLEKVKKNSQIKDLRK